MIIGIDLGTSNSLAGVYKDGRVQLIPSGNGVYIIPSVVSIDDDGAVYVGDLAKERLITHPDRTAAMFKRNIGTKETYNLAGHTYTAESLSAILLQSIKQNAEKYLGEEIKEAVISVPAFFLNPQRQAVLRAAKLAGLQVKKIINEPTAAAIAYNIAESNESDDSQRVIMVLDLGGGTFDISIMEATNEVMEVIAVCGDNKLGGRDFTNKMMELFLKKCNLGAISSPQDKEKLWKSAEKAKRILSEQGEATVSCVIGDELYTCKVTEEEYTKACRDLLEKMRKLIMRAVSESKYQSFEIDEIILIGGGTRLSIVKKLIEKMSGKKADYKINPDEAVVYGAALQGALYEKNHDLKNVVMTDVCPYYIGGCRFKSGRGFDGVLLKDVLIPKNHIIPACISDKLYSYPEENSLYVYQMEDEFGANEVLLGEVKFIVPYTQNEKTEIVRRVIFDSHGIIHHEVYIPCMDKTYTTSFSEMDDNDVEDVSRELEKLRYMNEEDENSILIAKAESLYCECIGEERERIGDLIGELEKALKLGKKGKRQITAARKAVSDFIERYE